MNARTHILLGLLAICLSGCGMDEVGTWFRKPLADDGQGAKAFHDTEENAEMNVAPHPEYDPVPPQQKAQVGIHYDPDVFHNGAYKPDELGNMINSRGFDGLAHQTFAEAGGDFDVDLDKTGKLMVYASTRWARNADICIQSVTGRAVTLHTSDPASDMMPKFTPEANHIAWASNRYGNWDVLVSPTKKNSRSRPDQVTSATEDEIHPTWSPDAVWHRSPEKAQGLLGFCRYNSMDASWQIWVLDVRTRSLSMITEGLFPEFQPVAPRKDGKDTVYTLLYQKHRRRDIPWYSIWSIEVAMSESGQVEVINSPTEIIASDQWAAINPCWSPDGKFLAFASVRKSPSAMWSARIYKADDIWVAGLDGRNMTQISRHSSPDWAPAWAVDAQSGKKSGRLYFHSLRNGHENVWSVSPLAAGLEE